MQPGRLNAILTSVTLVVLLVTGFTNRTDPAQMEELTLERLNIVDADGNVRVILAGSFPPRRAELAGLIFNHPSGVEAGGLVYRGAERDGRPDAGAILTFDKYGDDQVVALRYSESNGQRMQGLTFQDRPDSLGPEILSYYRRIDPMPAGPARDSLVAEMLRTVPPGQLASRRMFLGRDTRSSSIITLADPRGVTRLRLEVDSLGQAAITFLDESGTVVRTITP
ncbi:MAG TPA: hypothetical protein VF039_06275 [Longimicrobiales bacterium]